MSGTTLTAFIVFLVVFAYIYRIKHGQSGKSSGKTQQLQEQVQSQQQQIDYLQERVAALETIVTDSKFDLKREIDSL